MDAPLSIKKCPYPKVNELCYKMYAASCCQMMKSWMKRQGLCSISWRTYHT